MISHPNLKVRLDTITSEHFDLLRAWRNSPEIFQWCRQNDLLTEAKHASWMHNHPKDDRIKMYIIKNIMKEPVGVCGLTDIDLVNQRAEFSLYIGPEFHKSGYGRDALKLLLFHSFRAYPLNIIWGESFDGNPAIKMFESIGFKREGIRRDFYYRNGFHIDAILFSIKKDEVIL